MIEIKLIESNKKDFLDLLLLADKRESMIDKYLERGELFALYDIKADTPPCLWERATAPGYCGFTKSTALRCRTGSRTSSRTM